jgi:drug/metabolite transporter (DMT)-like permease
VKLTTIAASVVLVTTSPIFVAAGARVVFGDRIGRATLGGILVGLFGAAIVSGGDVQLSARAVGGDLLAIGGAAAAAGYFLAGRAIRRDVSLLTYVAVVYTTCAIALLPVALSAGPLAGFDAKTWWMLVLLAVVPQGIGHTTFNYLLRDVDATVVAISIMAEPIGSTLLAIAFFGEVPPWTAFLGGALILAGIYVAVTAQARTRRRERQPLSPLE